MVKKDFDNLAQVCMSIKSQFKPEDNDFDEVIRRFVWAILASPHGSHNFDESEFRDKCLGKKNFDQ